MGITPDREVGPSGLERTDMASVQTYLDTLVEHLLDECWSSDEIIDWLCNAIDEAIEKA